MRLLFGGVRGSTPAPGPEFVRYGGHTSCVALAHDGERPTLLLDAGTGLRQVTGWLEGMPFDGTLLLGHLHWDHMQGLPFFSAGDNEDARVDLFMPAQGDPVEVLERMVSPPFFPISPVELRGKWSFAALEPGTYEFEGFSVTALEIPHKGGRTFGYRISDGTATVTYMSDHSPIAFGEGVSGLGEYHEAACSLVDGTDLLIHDSQHTAAEFPQLSFLGHSAAEYAVGLAQRCGASKVLLFHHSPSRTDDQLDAMLESCRAAYGFSIDAASDGGIINLP
jgi:phosphoribosyl 1,2-cyclic phosphodiesterase